MARLQGLITAVLGLAVMAVPHHLLPTRTITTFTGAIQKEQCYSWNYHPELYLGTGILFLGLLQGFGRPRRKIWFLVAAFGSLVLVQAYVMMPPVFYLKKAAGLLAMDYNPVIWSGQTSIRAHIGIQYLLYILGSTTVLAAYSGLRGWEVELGQERRLTTSYIVLQGVRERAFRSTVVILLVGVASSALFAGSVIIEGSKLGLDSLTGRLGADIIVVPEERSYVAQELLLGSGFRPVYMDIGILQEVAALPGVEKASPQVFAGSFQYQKQNVPFTAGVVGIDPKTDFTVAPWLMFSLEGEMRSGQAIAGRGVKYVMGQTIPLEEGNFLVFGNLKRTGLAFFDNSIFVVMEDVERFPGVPPESISAVHVRVTPGHEVDTVAEEVEAIAGVSAIPVRRATAVVRDRLTGLFRTFGLIIAAVWLLAVITISLIFSMTASEGKRELGILRALGATRGFVLGLFTREAALLGLAGGVLGTVMGAAVIIAFKNAVISALKLPFVWPGDGFVLAMVLVTLAVSTGVGATGAAVSIKRGADIEPYELIRVGE
jgi:putative ABC transport system permease protein